MAEHDPSVELKAENARLIVLLEANSIRRRMQPVPVAPASRPEPSQISTDEKVAVRAQRVGKVLAGKGAVTADTDLRLCRFFGLSDGWWLWRQADDDTQIAKAALAKTLAKIKPWAARAEDKLRRD